MDHHNQFRILLPGGRLSHDTFFVPWEQPSRLPQGCLLAINQRDGARLAAHPTRLIPVANAQPRTACMKCGRVPGVSQDQVACPYNEGESCGLVNIQHGRSSAQAQGEQNRTLATR